MKELKTLKDLKMGPFTDSPFEFVFYDELKAEAVKRWKFAKEKENNTDDIGNQLYWRGRMDELEENFNLTEEDLK